MDEIVEFIQSFGIDEIEYTKINREYYKIDSNDKKLISGIKERADLEVKHVGEYLGIEAKKFIPSPALLDFINNNSSRKIIVNDEKAWVFLCGRDLLDVKVEGYAPILVLDYKNRVLGYGKKKGKNVMNYWDKGDFLRREKK